MYKYHRASRISLLEVLIQTQQKHILISLFQAFTPDSSFVRYLEQKLHYLGDYRSFEEFMVHEHKLYWRQICDISCLTSEVFFLDSKRVVRDLQKLYPEMIIANCITMIPAWPVNPGVKIGEMERRIILAGENVIKKGFELTIFAQKYDMPEAAMVLCTFFPPDVHKLLDSDQLETLKSLEQKLADKLITYSACEICERAFCLCTTTLSQRTSDPCPKHIDAHRYICSAHALCKYKGGDIFYTIRG